MKQYVFDQLRESDHEQIQKYLSNNAERTVLEEIFWVFLPKDLYTVHQGEHETCHPLYFAINLSLRQVAFELLIRSRETLRCSCIGYATPKQRDYIIHFADKMLEELSIQL